MGKDGLCENPTLEYNLGIAIGHILWPQMAHINYTDGLYRIGRKVSYMVASDIEAKDNLLKTYQHLDEVIAFNRYLERKYLPHTLCITINGVIDMRVINNIDELRDGMVKYLLDTDRCPYSLNHDNIEIITEGVITEFNFVLSD